MLVWDVLHTVEVRWRELKRWGCAGRRRRGWVGVWRRGLAASVRVCVACVTVWLGVYLCGWVSGCGGLRPQPKTQK